jgi:hypothetical protein
MLKDKILAELRKKYPGLAANVLGLLAEKLEPTVSEESQIEAAVTALENSPIKPADYAQFVQKEGDRRVTEALKKTPPKTDPPKNDPPKPADPNDPLAQLLQEVTKGTAKREQLEKREGQKTVTEQFHAKLTEKKIPISLAKIVNPESADQLDEALATVEAEWNTMKQDLTNQGLLTSLPKPGGIGTPGVVEQKKDAVEADIKAWAQKGQPAQKV